MSNISLSQYIDHTLLKPDAKEEDIIKLCKEAVLYGFASVCINPSHIQLAARELKGSNVNICTVIGFPLGASTTKVKAFEAEDAILKGAAEIDMVINIGKLKDKNYEYVRNDIKAVVEKCKGRAIVKVIIESCLLTEEEKTMACRISYEERSDFVKTSTGFSNGGATIEDVRLMRKVVGETMGVKASGGIKTYEDAIKMIEAGATRLGTSASINIINKTSIERDSY